MMEENREMKLEREGHGLFFFLKTQTKQILFSPSKSKRSNLNKLKKFGD